MLLIHVPSMEYFDERTQEFISFKGETLRLEHSLASLSKWEAKWCKSFLSTNDKTVEETNDYITFMSLDPVPENITSYLTVDNISAIKAYIESPMTATTIYEEPSKNKKTKETITSELIYYWMVALNIPFECQHWHLNRLLTLVRVCNVKNNPPKKKSSKDIMSRNAELNAARRQKLNTSG